MDAAQAILRQQADWIRQFPEVRFRVYGHTDAGWVRTATTSALGQRRANAVVDYLTSQGISRSRLEAVVSFGETQPLIVTQGRERRNRRTVTEVSGLCRSAIPPFWTANTPRSSIATTSPAPCHRRTLTTTVSARPSDDNIPAQILRANRLRRFLQDRR